MQGVNKEEWFEEKRTKVTQNTSRTLEPNVRCLRLRKRVQEQKHTCQDRRKRHHPAAPESRLDAEPSSHGAQHSNCRYNTVHHVCVAQRRVSRVGGLGLQVGCDEGEVQRVCDADCEPDQEGDGAVAGHTATAEEALEAACVVVLETLFEDLHLRKAL